MADKLLVLTVLIVLLGRGVFPAWMVAAIVARELLERLDRVVDPARRARLTWISRLDYARVAPGLLRGRAVA